MTERTASWEEWETVHADDLVGIPRHQVEFRTVDGKPYVMIDPLGSDALRDLLKAAYEHVDVEGRPFSKRRDAES